MCEILHFFRGGITVADYDSMSWHRRETVWNWMQYVIAEREKEARKGRG